MIAKLERLLGALLHVLFVFFYLFIWGVRGRPRRAPPAALPPPAWRARRRWRCGDSMPARTAGPLAPLPAHRSAPPGGRQPGLALLLLRGPGLHLHLRQLDQVGRRAPLVPGHGWEWNPGGASGWAAAVAFIFGNPVRWGGGPRWYQGMGGNGIRGGASGWAAAVAFAFGNPVRWDRGLRKG